MTSKNTGKTYTESEIIFHEHDINQEVYLIQTGRVGISKKIGEVEQKLAQLHPGEFFGEMSFLDNKPRSATAKALEKSRILCITPETFLPMIENNGNIAIQLIKKLTQRLREADNMIGALTQQAMNSKSAKKFLKEWENDEWKDSQQN
jgi:CRP/FNR family transcriptional regulator, cyclic AMP receptor protein